MNFLDSLDSVGVGITMFVIFGLCLQCVLTIRSFCITRRCIEDLEGRVCDLAEFKWNISEESRQMIMRHKLLEEYLSITLVDPNVKTTAYYKSNVSN